MSEAARATIRNPSRSTTLPGSLAPLRPDRFGYDQARHLLWRAGFGGTPTQIQTLASWGIERSVEHLVEFADIAFRAVRADEFDPDIMRPPTEAERLAYRRAQQAQDEETLARFRLLRQRQQQADREQMRRLRLWWLTRMIETPRPLEEKMTLFWHGHFATSYRKVENSYHMFLQNQRFRSHAAGNFGELLFEIIRDPAMIRYLDNDRSRAGQPNENLARELMELFSLGEGNYTERDIKEGARALTGYTFEGNEFVFREANHDQGKKRILGRSGPLDGDGFVRAILAQRSCSRFLATKLYRFFVADVPSSASEQPPPVRRAIDDLAESILRARYNLRPALTRLFTSEHFYHESVRLEQIKSPVLLVVGAVRSLLTPVRDLSILADAMDLMGQNLFFPPSVKGWDGGRSWINTSTLFVRQNILSYLLTGRTPSGYDPSARTDPYDPSPLLDALRDADPDAPENPELLADYLLRFALGRAAPVARDTLAGFVRTHGGEPTRSVVTGTLLLTSAMPEYQLA